MRRRIEVARRDSDSLLKVNQVIKDRLASLEAARAAGQICLELAQESLKHSKRMDEGLAHRIACPPEKPEDDQPGIPALLQARQRVLEGALSLAKRCLHDHGAGSDDLDDFSELLTRTALSPEERAESKTVQLISQSILEKSKVFRVPLPAAIAEDVAKTTGRSETDSEKE